MHDRVQNMSLLTNIGVFVLLATSDEKELENYKENDEDIILTIVITHT